MNNLSNPGDTLARAVRERNYRVISRSDAMVRPILVRIDSALRSEPTAPPAANPPQIDPTFSRWRAAGGAVFGASVPVSVFTISQLIPPETMLDTWRNFGLWVAVLGGLVFSAGTVYAYGCTVFRDPTTRLPKKWKAASFCLLAETIMTLAPSMFLPLQVAMLAILVLSNAVETGRNAGAAS